MKFGMACEVEGQTKLEDGITIELPGMRYVFYVTDPFERRLKQVRLISDVGDPKNYFYYRSPVQANGTFTIVKGYEESVYRNLVEEMQRLESILALAGNIRKVHWEKAVFEYYPETTEEHAQINIIPPYFFIHELPHNDPVEISSEALAQLVNHTNIFKPLVVPMSFLRETKNEYTGGRYINSFFNSYFIIEGLFGNGKWRKDAIIKELTESETFSSFVQNFLDEIGTNTDPEQGMTKQQLEEELLRSNQPYTVGGLVSHIVETRGKLHHFSIKSTQKQGTPFNHLDYKKIALIAMALAGNSLTHFLSLEVRNGKAP